MLRAVFEGEKYVSYIALMRELRLEHEFADGDWFIDSAGFVGLYYSASISYGDEPRDAIPLPRLDQWLAMLEAAGWVFHLTARQPGYAIWASREGLHGREEGPTPEEAAARLWMTVTGKTTA